MTEPGSERQRVWVVDDSPLDAERAARVLGATCRVDTLSDGPSVLDRLMRDPPPDVLVLDWIMPDVSGLDVVRFLRGSEREALRDLKVLLLTAQGNPEQVAEGLSAGANDYLAKPYAPVELEARVAALVRSRQLSMRAREAEGAVRDLLAQAPDATLAIDAEGCVTWANEEARRVLGDAVVGQLITVLIPDLRLERVLRPGPSTDLAVAERIYAPSVRAVSGDTFGGTVLALRDVTDARRSANRRLDFYSMSAHDLRSPLSNLLLRTQLLAQGVFGTVDQRIRLELQRIEDSGRQLVTLIDDFLEIARFESMAHNMQREIVDLRDLAAEVCEEYQPTVRDQGLELAMDCANDAVLVIGDPRRLRQVLTNLLSNAIKFTSSGGHVSVRVWQEDQDCCVSVRDTGRGIPPELVARLFARYVREEGKRGGAPGTGLGLMIVCEIVQVHGGSVNVESVVDEGSTFVVRFPAA